MGAGFAGLALTSLLDQDGFFARFFLLATPGSILGGLLSVLDHKDFDLAFLDTTRH